VLYNDTSKVFLTTGHETHPENQLALERFKHICNQRAQDEQTSLRVIYNEVSIIYYNYKHQLYSKEVNRKVLLYDTF